MFAIINASPLIFLAKIRAIHLLSELFSNCYTTKEVKDEILYPKDFPENILLKETFSNWLSVKEPKNQKLIKKLLKLQIHLGEATIIALSKELQNQQKNNVLIIDDLSARDIARTLDLKTTGTLGILLKATHLKLINKEKCKSLIQDLIENSSFRISTELYIKIIKEIEDI